MKQSLFVVLVLVACCGVGLVQSQPYPFGPYHNSWDGVLNVYCPPGSLMHGLYSTFSSRKNDRRWSMTCVWTDIGSQQQAWPNYNNYRDTFSFTCPSDWAIEKLYSYHSNRREDRIWTFTCKSTKYGTNSCAWSAYNNDFGGTMNYQSPANELVTGMGSYYSRRVEDRRWRFYSCNVDCDSTIGLSLHPANPWKCQCDSGRYLSGLSCLSCRTCSAGYYASTACSPEQNRACSACPTGKYQSSSSYTGSSCSNCPAGKYTDQTGRSGCKTCSSLGKYQPSTGQNHCETCSTGYYANSDGSGQIQCQPGYRCSGSCDRTSCSAGTYQNQYGQTVCKSCPSGKFQDQSAQSSCKSCSSGYYISSVTAQTQCQAGYRCVGCNRYACVSGVTYQDQSGQTSCKSVRTCGAGQLQSSSPTTTSNRGCSSCQLGSNYQDQTSHTYTSCKSLSNCGAGSYVSTAPTLSSNRACTGCPSGKYTTSSNQGSCSTWSTCTRGQYVSTTGTSSRNIGCSLCSLGSGYQDQASHRSTSCKAVSGVCSPGYYQSAAPTLSSDRSCSACPSGKYQNQHDQGTCKPWSTCPAGQYQASGPTATADRVCNKCDGTSGYQNQAGQTSCKSVTGCSSTQYQSSAPTPTSNRVCAACRTSSACSSNQYLAGSCSLYSNPYCQNCHSSCATCNGGNANQCTSCTSPLVFFPALGTCAPPLACSSNQYETSTGCKPCDSSCATCDGGSSSNCLSCPTNRYLLGKSCLTQSACTGSGPYYANPDNNRCLRCTTCTGSTYSSTVCGGTTNTVCSPWTVCSPGSYQTISPSSTQNRVCSSCSQGSTYQPSSGATSCIAVSQCPPGQQVASNPTLTSDRTCSSCSAGTYKPTTGQSSCQACPAGTKAPSSGASSCTDCGRGFYQDQTGQSSCKTVQAGYYGDGGTGPDSRTSQVGCQAGYYCTGGSASRLPCDGVTKYQDQTLQTTCKTITTCTASQYQTTPPTTTSNRACATCTTAASCASNQFLSGSCSLTSNPTCKACHSTCATCNGPAASNCLTCPPTLSYNPTTNTCSNPTCTSSQYLSGGQCLSCHSSCATCDGPNSNNCLSCSGSLYYLNRECVTLSTCNAHPSGPYYGRKDATNGNRCLLCSSCTSSTYASSTCSGNSDTTCSPWTVCQPGQRETTAPSPTQNRVCVACTLGTNYQPSASATSCLPVTTCAPGQTQNVAPTTSSDRTCKSCAPGTFKSTSGQDACTPCPAGTFNPSSGQSSCKDCGAGFYTGSTSSLSCATVQAGFYGTGGSSPSTSTAQTPCPVGSACPGGASPPIACDGVNTYQNLAQQPSCKSISTCPTGQYQTTGPTPTSDRTCAACTTAASCTSKQYLSGTCTATSNPSCQPCHASCTTCSGPSLNQCTSCTAPLVLDGAGKCQSPLSCPDGQFDNVGVCGTCHSSCATCDGPAASDCLSCKGSLYLLGTTCISLTACTGHPSGPYYGSQATNDNRCLRCSSCSGSTYASSACAGNSDTTCTAWTTCKAGQRQSAPPTATSDRVCTSCVLNTNYQPDTGAANCLPVSVCLPGSTQDAAPTTSSDRTCKPCPAGTYKSDSGNGACVACPAGTFSASSSSSVCTPCGADKYQPSTGQTSCKTVSAGFYASGGSSPTTHTTQLPCEAGYKCPGGSSPPIACDGVNTYQDLTQQSSCKTITTCSSTQYQTLTPTTTRDRTCAACTLASSCATDEFLQSTCSLNTNPSCQPCDPSCATCTGPKANECATCSGSLVFYPDTSTCEFPRLCQATEYRAADGTCKACNAACYSCDGPDASDCLACTGTAYLLGRTCISLTACTGHPSGPYYGSQATNDNRCLSCDTCAGANWESAACTANSDTVCTPWTTCKAGQQETALPTLSSDRVCAACTVGTNYQPNPGMSSCLPVTVCSPGTIQDAAPTATSDRTCKACPAGTFTASSGATTCTPCPAGTASTATGATACSPCGPDKTQSSTGQTSCTVVPAGFYGSGGTTPSTHTTQTPCPDGNRCPGGASPPIACDGVTTYQDQTQQSTCKTITTCSSTQYQTTPPTTSSDRVCTACTAASSCATNEFLEGACTATSNPSCQPCDPSCATCTGPKANECASCDATLNLVFYAATATCGPPPACDEDEYQLVGTSNCAACHSSCASCDGPNADDCLSCADPLYLLDNQCISLTDCTTHPAGPFFGSKGSGSSNNVCLRCATCTDATWASAACSGNLDTTCTPWTVCDVGQEASNNPSATVDRTCAACVLGVDFASSAGSDFCTPVTVCGAGQEETTPPTLSSDRVCTPCGGGYFRSSSDPSVGLKCLPCPPGSFQDTTGASSCKDCGAGFYQPQTGRQSCLAVQPGFYGSGGQGPDTATTQTPCPAGFMCPGDDSPPIACDGITTYQDQTQQSTCKPVSSCIPPKTPAASPTATSDRVCDACPAGQFRNDDVDKCTPWSDCPIGFFVVAPMPSATQNRVCSPCNGETQYTDVLNPTSCKTVTICPEGAEESVAPSSSTDRECVSCVVGVSFQPNSNSLDCLNVTDCVAGFEQTRAPTTSTDRVCTACNGVTEYQDENAQIDCKPVSLCGMGQYASQAPTTSTDRVCLPCNAGKFQPSPESTATSCSAWSSCPPGDYIVTDGTPTSDRVCADCTAGTNYQALENQAACLPVSTCPAGSIQSAPPTTLSDRVCTNCTLDVNYMDLAENTATACLPLTTCVAGQYELFAPTISTDRVCDSCDGIAFYQDEAGQETCKPLTTCSSTQYETKAPTASSNRVCSACTKASSCASREFLDGQCTPTSNPVCVSCDASCSKCTGTGPKNCTSCSGDLNFDDATNTCISECPVGQYENSVSNTCDDCDPTCKDCEDGTANDCTSCNDGRFLNLATRACVTVCPTGFWGNTADNTCHECSVCTGSTYASTACQAQADTVCTAWSQCKVGQEEDVPPTNLRDRTCRTCPTGQYQDAPNELFCLDVTECDFPLQENQAPTPSTDRTCECDTSGCTQLVTRVYNELLCGIPSSDDLARDIERCCDGQDENNLRAFLLDSPAYETRHTCDGCDATTCNCKAGWFLTTQGQQQVCSACNGVTTFSGADGATSCSTITTCAAGTEQTIAPTASSDRVCSSCSAGTTDADSDGSTPCVTCPAGTYVPPNSIGSCDTFLCPAGTADTDSNPATQCQTCVLGNAYQPTRGQTTCIPVKECGPGTQVVSAPTIFADRQCVPCSPGTFKTDSGPSACQAVTVCAAGEEQSVAPTRSSDRTCVSCVEGTTFKPERGQSTTCRPITVCGPGQEEIRAPTTFSDRVCRSCVLGVSYLKDGACVPVTDCDFSQFEEAAATLTSDAVCTSLETCAADEYQSTMPTPSTNRACSPCTTCDSSSIMLRPCSAALDATCTGCAACDSSEYLLRPCTGFTDSVCISCRECSPAEYISRPCSSNNDTVCSFLTVCNPTTQYQLTPPTPSTNRVCANLTVCTPDEYESEAPTPTTDRECTALDTCLPGDYVQPGRKFNEQRTCIPCAAGQSDEDFNNQCKWCKPGEATEPGSVGPCEEYECRQGETDLDSSPETSCVECTEGANYTDVSGHIGPCKPVQQCEAGFMEIRAPTIFADRICHQCVSGATFKPLAGQSTTCQPVSPCAAIGIEYQTAAPTITTDRVCATVRTCTSSEYETVAPGQFNNRECAPLTQCDFSTQWQSTAPTTTSDRRCTNLTVCDTANQWESQAKTDTSDRVCSPLRVCTFGEFESVAPTPTSNRQCIPRYQVRMHFNDANFTEVIGSGDPLATPFAAAMNDWFGDNGISTASMIGTFNITAGSIIVSLWDTSPAVRNTLMNEIASGNMEVMNYTALPCSGDQYILPIDLFALDTVPNCQMKTVCDTRFQFANKTATPFSDAECADLTVCTVGQTVIAPPTYSTNRVCGVSSASRAGTTSNATVIPVVVILLLLLIVAVVGFLWYRKRHSQRAEQADIFVKDLADQLDNIRSRQLGQEVRGANEMLRQLSVKNAQSRGGKGGSVTMFDNPMFAPPTGGDPNQGYLDCNTGPPWLIGWCEREDCEKYIRDTCTKQGDFVVRESPKNNSWVISILNDPSYNAARPIEHHKLSITPEHTFLVNGKNPSVECRSVLDVIKHMSSHTDAGNSVFVNYTLPENEENLYGAPGTHDAAIYGTIGDDVYGSVSRPSKPKWLYDAVSRQNAEEMLLNNPYPGKFLVRQSKNHPGVWAISMVLDDLRTCEHHQLKQIVNEDGDTLFTLNSQPLSRLVPTLAGVVNHLYGHIESMSRTLVPPAGDDYVYNASASGYSDLPGGMSNPNYTGGMHTSSVSNPGYAMGMGGGPSNPVGYLDTYPNKPGAPYAELPGMSNDDMDNGGYDNATTATLAADGSLVLATDEDTYTYHVPRGADLAPELPPKESDYRELSDEPSYVNVNRSAF